MNVTAVRSAGRDRPSSPLLGKLVVMPPTVWVLTGVPARVSWSMMMGVVRPNDGSGASLPNTPG